MKIISKNSGKCSIIRAQIENINGNKIDCVHISSKFKLKATANEDMHLEVGQVVVLEFRGNNRNSGYVVVDALIEQMKVVVLEAHHIISDGVMYTSLILENPETKSRMHSLVPNYDKLFNLTNIIVRGDTLNIRINNGRIFDIVND